jgi:hypothetical protein
MGKILKRKILTEDTYTSISVDRETHDTVKYWAKKESNSMAQATKIMVLTYVRTIILKEKRGKVPVERAETYGQLIQTLREAKRKITDKRLTKF